MKCIKKAARLLNKDYIKRRGLDLSKEVLWVSVGQRTAELPVIKVRGKKSSAAQPAVADFFFKPPTLPAGNLAAL